MPEQIIVSIELSGREVASQSSWKNTIFSKSPASWIEFLMLTGERSMPMANFAPFFAAVIALKPLPHA